MQPCTFSVRFHSEVIMFRPIFCNRLKPLQWQAVAGHKNWVKSPALQQLEQLCEQYCHVPRIPPRKVCGGTRSIAMDRYLRLLL